jgi:pilus assembly protein CpaE
LEDQPLAVIPFEPQIFGTAANNGQMVAEVSSNHKTAQIFLQLAQVLTGRAEVKRSRSGLLTPLLAKLKKRLG